MADLVTLEEIRAARTALPPEVRRTPLIPCAPWYSGPGAPAFLKPENLQVTGSYKPRAAFTILHRLPPGARARGVAMASSGNFGQAMAYAGQVAGVRVAIVMMEGTAPVKVEATRRWGAEVVFCERSIRARWEAVQRLERERGMTAVNAYEEPAVIAGHGTIGLEIVEDRPEVGTVLVPVSSGGLLAGTATAVKALRPRARVIGVQPEGVPAATLSFRRRESVETPTAISIADALVATKPGRLPLEHIWKSVDDMVLVSEAEIASSLRLLLEAGKILAEPAGAVALAALLHGKVPAPVPPVVAVVSGGNVGLDRLRGLLEETP